MLIFLLFNFVRIVSPNGHGGTFGEKHVFNLTVNHLASRSIEVSWSCDGQTYDKYEVSIQAKDYKIVKTVPHNLCYVVMDNLVPSTDYRISVASTLGGVKRRSSKVYFRTLMEVEDSPVAEIKPEEDTRSRSGLKLPNVRLVEISLVAMALILWAGAIVLFFHRWGKIRMLLPYQPQYKEMKPNGSSTCTNCSMTPHHQVDYPIGMRIYRKALSCDQLPLSRRFWFDDTDLSDA